ncbi:MAG TPA: hypothetical protein VGQ57_07535 [Polyangiaceae bacterium]|nr:hypothetical protein [Polyangiaceae bacterium]
MLKKLVAGGALIVAWAIGCSSKSTNDFACATGQVNCSCYADDSCADGLVCNQRHQCVKPGGSGGSAGKAGDGSANQTGDAGQTMSSTGGSSAAAGGQSSSSGGKSTTGKGGKGGKSTTGSGGSSDGAMSGTDSGAAGDGGALDQGGAGGRDDGLGGMLGKGGSGATGGLSGSGGSSSGTGGLGGGGGMAGTVSTGGGGAGAGLGGVSGLGGAGGKSGAGGNGGSSGKCTELTVGSVMYYRDLTDSPDIAVYVYRTNQFGAASADYLEVQFYSSSYDSSDNGEDTGTFTLGTGIDANFKTCARCLLVDRDLVAGDATATYFATSGSMIVAAGSDQMNGEPKVTLNDVTLSEVTIDDTTSESTLVEGGKCVHLTTAKVQIPAGWTCSLDAYSTDDGCDCGCGVRDGDCDNGNVSSCDTCHCGSTTSCNAVSTMNNALCK